MQVVNILFFLFIFFTAGDTFEIIIKNVTSERKFNDCLIKDIDKLVLTAEAFLPTDIHLPDYALSFNVKYKVSDEFKTLCTVLLALPCDEKTERKCYCNKKNNSYEIIFNKSAETLYSDAFIKASIKLARNGEIAESQVVKIPKILDQVPAIIRHDLLMDNQSVINRTITISTDKLILPVNFQCETYPATQSCQLYYGVDGEDYFKMNGSVINLTKCEYKSPSRLLIRLKTCGEDQESYKLNLKYESITTTTVIYPFMTTALIKQGILFVENTNMTIGFAIVAPIAIISGIMNILLIKKLRDKNHSKDKIGRDKGEKHTFIQPI